MPRAAISSIRTGVSADRSGSRPTTPSCAATTFRATIGCATRSGSSGSIATAISRFEAGRSEEHTSELQSLMRISYAVFCVKKKKNEIQTHGRVEHTHETDYSRHLRIDSSAHSAD